MLRWNLSLTGGNLRASSPLVHGGGFHALQGLLPYNVCTLGFHNAEVENLMLGLLLMADAFPACTKSCNRPITENKSWLP